MAVQLEILDGWNYQRDEDGWEHHAFTLRLTRGGESMTVPWRQGLGIDEDPTATTVLESLLLDSEGWTDDFEEWAENYGYDTDSRKAEQTWREVGEQREALEALLGDDFYPSITEGDAESNARRLVRG